MAPRGIGVVIAAAAAGSDNGLNIARILSNPNMGNLAVALLSPHHRSLPEIRNTILTQNPSSIIETFPTSHNPSAVRQSFADVRQHPSFASLPLSLSIFTVSSNDPTPFGDAAFQTYRESLPLSSNIKTAAPIYIYERTTRPSPKAKDKWHLIGSFVSCRRAGVFMEMSAAEVQRYAMSGTVYKERFKFSYK